MISSATARTTIHRILTVVLAAMVAVGLSVAIAGPASAGTDQDEARLFELQNQARAENGKAALAYDPAAVGVARAWAQELARSGNLRHNPDLVAQVDAHVTTQWTRVGENVGYARDADQVFNAYMNSAGHRANILGDYNRVGVGAARGADGRLWTTVVFIKGPAIAQAAPPPQYPFTDISGSVHLDNIVFAANVGLLKGGPAGLPTDQFGPGLLMTRGQLATLVRNLVGPGVNPSSSPDAFSDDNGSVHEANINALAALGIIGGNGDSGSSYFPSANATRSQIASFLGRAYVRTTGRALPTSPDAFTDDEGDPAEAEINGLAALGVIAGKAPGTFDPSANVTRAQVATMVVKLLAEIF